jgi:LmbE family N-acetylglucosaminyl deacetylase
VNAATGKGSGPGRARRARSARRARWRPAREIHVYLSPHLDDAVLSCGGTIAATARAGHDVIVVTLFSRATAAAAAGVRAAYARRAREDRVAARLLGFRAVHAGLPDAPWRDPRYRTYRAIVFDDRSPPPEAVRAARDAILAVLDRLPAPHRIFAPLGAGGHVDHRVTCAAALGLPGRPHHACGPILYEDRPYAFLPDAVPLRWRDLAARVAEPVPARGAPASRASARPPAPAHALASLMARYFADARDRDHSLRLIEIRRRALDASDSAAHAWRLERTVYRRQARTLAGVDRTLLVRAIAAYRSQLPDLFGLEDPRAGALASLRRIWTAAGAWQEVTWWPARSLRSRSS